MKKVCFLLVFCLFISSNMFAAGENDKTSKVSKTDEPKIEVDGTSKNKINHYFFGFQVGGLFMNKDYNNVLTNINNEQDYNNINSSLFLGYVYKMFSSYVKLNASGDSRSEYSKYKVDNTHYYLSSYNNTYYSVDIDVKYKYVIPSIPKLGFGAGFGFGYNWNVSSVDKVDYEDTSSSTDDTFIDDNSYNSVVNYMSANFIVDVEYMFNPTMSVLIGYEYRLPISDEFNDEKPSVNEFNVGFRFYF